MKQPLWVCVTPVLSEWHKQKVCVEEDCDRGVPIQRYTESTHSCRHLGDCRVLWGGGILMGLPGHYPTKREMPFRLPPCLLLHRAVCILFYFILLFLTKAKKKLIKPLLGRSLTECNTSRYYEVSPKTLNSIVTKFLPVHRLSKFLRFIFRKMKYSTDRSAELSSIQWKRCSARDTQSKASFSVSHEIYFLYLNY